MLKPELQNMDTFVDGVLNIAETQQRVAMQYFEDGSVDMACPPLKALLHIMAGGNYEGKNAHHPDIRAMFTLDSLLKSEWYHQRLRNKQNCDIALYRRHAEYVRNAIDQFCDDALAARLNLADRLKTAEAQLQYVQSADYLKKLEGTIGRDTF